ncbi:PLP-dependent aminotransferase family protein [Caulobacter mirabilis]|uniref:aminotransferase-like domain-containing protein n=1 Tax=Caulobacter mirabilis TaxID=69666 RepID=UPI001FE30038|nr:PLP-dependent aminotransferase family protein [Caulobacter mirabilis]
MALDDPSLRWLKRVSRDEGPIYLAVVAALEAAIRDGELTPGDRLPPQRTVAAVLGVDFTTVTRAYGAARSRGLVEGTVGRGTFIRGRSAEDEVGLVDLSMNLPPQPEGLSLANLLRDTTRAVLERTDVATLMAYHPDAGSTAQRLAGATWLAPVLGEIATDRLLLAPGAQTALAVTLSTLLKQGAGVICEPLTYPGLIAVARRLGLKLIACPVDDEGFQPDALARRLSEGAAAVYCVPTMQNPTAVTMSLARRREIARIVHHADAWIIEDDPYSRLLEAPPPALAALAPERTIHIATVSKTLTPGLRTAFLAAPAGEVVERLAEGLRATVLMASPLTAAVTTHWIREGVAERILEGVRAAARTRRALAGAILPTAFGMAESLHVWLDLPADRDPATLRELARRRGLALVTADAFAVGQPTRNGVRISLGAAGKAATLETALRSVAALAAAGGERSRTIV